MKPGYLWTYADGLLASRASVWILSLGTLRPPLSDAKAELIAAAVADDSTTEEELFDES
jgi:hypothetical protein